MLYEHELVAKGLARWHNGRLIPIMRGGDQRADAQFPELPEDLAALDDDELQSLHDKFQTGGRALLAAAKDRDAEVLGERTTKDVDDELTAAADALSKIRAEQDSRKSDEEAFDARLNEVSNVFGADTVTDEDADAPADEPETADETAETAETAEEETTETEATTAAATRTRRPLPLSKKHKPVAPDVDASGFRSQIRSEVINVAFGDQVEPGPRGIGELLNHAVRRNVVSPGARQIVASATFDFDTARQLGKQEDGNVERIRRVREELHKQALTASGALCAPLEPLYDIFGVSTAVRPVRDVLPSFQASRGGVITRAAPLLGDYADAVGHITADDNASGGSLAVKGCMRLICPDPDSVEVDSIYSCIEADNLASRSDPELMAAIDELVRAEQARLADGFLLDQIKTGSTAVTGDAGGDGGATFNLVGDIFKAAAGYRSRHRMPEGAVLNAMFPAWVADLLALDVARAAGYQTPLSREGVQAWLRGKGIAPTYYLDGTADATNGQVFGTQTAGSILDFPATVEWFLFAPGTWLHLDAGTLDLGVVRDSTLNSTNDFQIFAETWENVAFVGVESQVITSAVCPSGTFSAGIDLKNVC